MAGMMGPWGGGYDGYGYGMTGSWYPFAGVWMIIIWVIVFGIIGYIVYLDANRRGMHGLLWWILVLIPMAGILALFLYLILREAREHGGSSRAPVDILKERYAKGELTPEQFRSMSEELKR